MKNSTKIATSVLIIIGICLFTINGIKPTIKKSKEYSDGKLLIQDALINTENIIEIDYSRDVKYRKEAEDIALMNIAETVSKRQRSIIADMLNKNNRYNIAILPNFGGEYIFNVFSYDENMKNQYEIQKLKQDEYTQTVKNLIIDYNKSFEYIPKYKKANDFEVYKVTFNYKIQEKDNVNFVGYFIVVDEGEGLVIDYMKIVQEARE